MIVTQAIEILNPYDWLPSYGESGIKLKSDKLVLKVIINYDGASKNLERTMRFDGVCSFYMGAFPGPSMLAFEGRNGALLLSGALIEYSMSDAAAAWNRHFLGHKQIRHFNIIFLAENSSLTVFAEHVSIGDPVGVV